MTRKELLKMLFPEYDIDESYCDGLKCDANGCKTCKNLHYWDEPVVLSKDVVKSILNSIYGNALYGTLKSSLYHDTDSIYFVYSGRGNGKNYAQHLELIREGWTQLPSIHNNIDWTTLNEIMCDAIVNGFEVKILNGTIYYREKQ